MSEYLKRFVKKIRGLSLPPDVMPLGYLACKEIEELSDDRFWQVFCASHTALRMATTSLTEKGTQVANRQQIIDLAIKDAQEALRQVGELNKEQARDS